MVPAGRREGGGTGRKASAASLRPRIAGRRPPHPATKARAVRRRDSAPALPRPPRSFGPLRTRRRSPEGGEREHSAPAQRPAVEAAPGPPHLHSHEGAGRTPSSRVDPLRMRFILFLSPPPPPLPQPTQEGSSWPEIFAGEGKQEKKDEGEKVRERWQRCALARGPFSPSAAASMVASGWLPGMPESTSGS